MALSKIGHLSNAGENSLNWMDLYVDHFTLQTIGLGKKWHIVAPDESCLAP